MTRNANQPKSTRQTLRIRSFKYDKYREDIQSHHQYLETLYNGDLDQVAISIQTIIQDSLDLQAPMKTILISNKNKTKISKEARELMVLRDMAHQEHKESGSLNDLRAMRHYRNMANKQISKDNYLQRTRSLQDNKISDKERWRRIKTQTGQNNFKSPQIIVEGQKQHKSPGDMAVALNRQYISIINVLTSCEAKISLPSWTKAMALVSSCSACFSRYAGV